MSTSETGSGDGVDGGTVRSGRTATLSFSFLPSPTARLAGGGDERSLGGEKCVSDMGALFLENVRLRRPTALRGLFSALVGVVVSVLRRGLPRLVVGVTSWSLAVVAAAASVHRLPPPRREDVVSIGGGRRSSGESAPR